MLIRKYKYFYTLQVILTKKLKKNLKFSFCSVILSCFQTKVVPPGLEPGTT